MCDYSLMGVPNRLAREGEVLVAHRFPTGSLGLACPDDVNRVNEPKPKVKRTWWASIREFFDPPAAPAVAAVCIPPGARLEMQEVPERLQQQWGVGREVEVLFTQLSANPHTYRDALRFPDGRAVRLQELREGTLLKVLDLSGSEAVTWDRELELTS